MKRALVAPCLVALCLLAAVACGISSKPAPAHHRVRTEKSHRRRPAYAAKGHPSHPHPHPHPHGISDHHHHPHPHPHLEGPDGHHHPY